jgi:hypothetical protein
MDVDTYARLLARKHHPEALAEALRETGLTREQWEQRAAAMHARLRKSEHAEELRTFARLYREQRRRVHTAPDQSVDETSALVFDLGAPLPFEEKPPSPPAPMSSQPNVEVGATAEVAIDDLDGTLPFTHPVEVDDEG